MTIPTSGALAVLYTETKSSLCGGLEGCNEGNAARVYGTDGGGKPV